MIYQIGETLIPSSLETCIRDKAKYVAVLTPEEWTRTADCFEMGIDIEMRLIDVTKAEVNYDSVTGCISIPDRKDITGPRRTFLFALDEKGIVFIDEKDTAQKLIERVIQSKKWKLPSLERFIYDFLEQIVTGDLAMLSTYETRMDKIEDQVLKEDMDGVVQEINDIRSDLLDLHTHYEQLVDLGQELEENENNFFAMENLRYFHLFTVRVERLRDQVRSLRDYSMQIRDLYQAQTDVKQNRIMSVLTIISTIFFPLSLITGWYGMNFVYMPELDYVWAYPVIILVCILIVIGGLVYFKKKKWL